MAQNKKKAKNQGNPAKNDPLVALQKRLYSWMREGVLLTRDLQNYLDEQHYEYLRSSALGAMFVYSDITGLPSPLDYIEYDAAWEERENQKSTEQPYRCPLCDRQKFQGNNYICDACGRNYKEKYNEWLRVSRANAAENADTPLVNTSGLMDPSRVPATFRSASATGKL